MIYAYLIFINVIGFFIMILDKKRAIKKERVLVTTLTKKLAEELKAKLDKEVLEFKVKTGENYRVFWSISQKQIKDSLQEKGYKLEKSQIDNSNQISSLGFHNVNINIYGNIKATVKVHLVKWGDA